VQSRKRRPCDDTGCKVPQPRKTTTTMAGATNTSMKGTADSRFVGSARRSPTSTDVRRALDTFVDLVWMNLLERAQAAGLVSSSHAKQGRGFSG